VLLLKDARDHWQCVAASDEKLIRLRWLQGRFFDHVAAGRICARSDNHELPEWSEIPPQMIAPGQSVLYLPLRVHGERGVLVLLRPLNGGHLMTATSLLPAGWRYWQWRRWRRATPGACKLSCAKCEARWIGCVKANRISRVAHTRMN
jgi:hypothetical protein